MASRTLIFALFFASFAASGCGPDCESLCEDWAEENCCDKNDIEGAGCIDDPEDCELYCVQTTALAEKSGCEDELEAWDDCAAELEDICDDNSSCTCAGDTGCEYSCENGQCDREVADYYQCTYDYCSDHPTAYACI